MRQLIRINGRKRIIYRDSRGRFIRKRYAKKKRHYDPKIRHIKHKKEIRKESKKENKKESRKEHKKIHKHLTFSDKNKQLKSSFLKTERKKSKKKLYKKNIVSKTAFSRVNEYRLRRPIPTRRGVMVIEFLFIKLAHGRYISRHSTGYSNKMMFPREFEKGYDLCLRRAMSKIDFSPDNVKIIEITYNYYISKKSRFMDRL